MKKAGWLNWINLLLGIALVIEPWLVRHNLPAATVNFINWNFWIVGGLIIISAGSALRDLTLWEERLNLGLGLWLIISPWVLGYANESTLMLNAIIIGVAIVILSLMALPIAKKIQQH